MSTSDGRLNELEGHYMHLEKTVEQLSEVVIEQQAELERLRRQITALREQLASGDSPGEPGDDSPPPHY